MIILYNIQNDLSCYSLYLSISEMVDNFSIKTNGTPKCHQQKARLVRFFRAHRKIH